MEKKHFAMAMVAVAVPSLAALVLFSNIASAQTADVTSQAAAPALLNAVETDQQNILADVNQELLGAALEVSALPSMPMQTVNDQEALADEFNALAIRLNNLESITNTLSEAQSQENSIAATLQ